MHSGRAARQASTTPVYASELASLGGREGAKPVICPAGGLYCSVAVSLSLAFYCTFVSFAPVPEKTSIHIVSENAQRGQQSLQQLYASMESNLALDKHAEEWEWKELNINQTGTGRKP